MSDESTNLPDDNAPRDGSPEGGADQPPPRQLSDANPQAQFQSQTQFQQQQNQMQQQQQQHSAAASPSAAAQAGLLQDYVPADQGFNENVDESHQVRRHWKKLDGLLGKVGRDGMDRRLKQIRRTIHQNGIAFSSYGDPSDRERHLQLDPLPQLIPADEWKRIDVALKQRASLLNLMLADLYGARTLLSEGVLPPEVLFEHPHYQVPYHELPPPAGKHLHFYGAELFRSPTGDWWVMSDRTDSPGGSGFALENRLAISRAFAGEFRRCSVRRLAPFFIALREQLSSLAPQNRENPHIAILSAGLGSASYFEDSFLAKYLGFTLVETKDLVVRSGRVMLKTLAGLTPIDVIMRRQQGNQLDPLELGGGAPGVAGILQVIRDGNVAIASAPGSGLVESPVFMAFMPRVCQAMLGTDLMLPGVATYWGGEASSLEIILDTIDDISLLPAFRQRTIIGVPQSAHKSLEPQKLSRSERIELVRKNPSAWVGQERVVRSSAAVWDRGKVGSGYVSMRAFLVAKGDSWHSMPGGLSRITDFPSDPVRTPFRGGGAKDVWVLSDGPVEQVSLVKAFDEPLAAQRGGGLLPSRVAENLCWLGRYTERADAAARLLRAVVGRLTSEVSPAESVELPVLIRTLAIEGRIDAGFAVDVISRQLPELDQCLADNTLDRFDPNSLRSLVDQVASLATSVRERLSADTWRIVQKISKNFDQFTPAECDLSDLLELTHDLILDLASFSGLVNESMTRTDGFRFLNLGRRLEHGLQIIALVKDCLLQKEPPTNELLEAVLETADSIMTYRSRYYANLQLSAVLDLLLLDEMNPRSLAFQLVDLGKNLRSLPGNKDSSKFPLEQRLTMDALHSIRMADFGELSSAFVSGDRLPLLDLLTKIEEILPQVSTAISNRYLVHSGPVHQMISGKFPRKR